MCDVPALHQYLVLRSGALREDAKDKRRQHRVERIEQEHIHDPCDPMLTNCIEHLLQRLASDYGTECAEAQKSPRLEINSDLLASCSSVGGGVVDVD